VAAGFQGGSIILKPIKWYAALHTAKGRAESGVFLVEGLRAIRQIIHTAPHLITEVVYPQDGGDGGGFPYPSRVLTGAQYRTVALSRQGCGPLAVVTVPGGWDEAVLPRERGRKILVLEDVQDPGNVGTLIRSAAAFGFSGVILSRKCADPFSPKSTQASCGAVVSLWVRRTDRYRHLLRELKAGGLTVVALDIHGKAWNPNAPAPRCVALVLGNEGNGLTGETMRLADEIVKIPFDEDKVESLNVAACGAVSMYLASSQGNSGPAVSF
jgi:RNA methyltransferase, TrmH family